MMQEPGGDRFGDIARKADTAIGNDGMFRSASAAATLATAEIWGTPIPATIRVVQIEPGPIPTFTRRHPLLRGQWPPAVAMLPPTT